MSFRVILIDDNETDIALASTAIQAVAPNAKLEVIRDGETALSYLMRIEPLGQPTIRLVLLDLVLPRSYGLDVLRTMRKMGVRASMPIVVFSVKDSPEIIEEAYGLGAKGYVVKPTDPAQLRERLDSVLRYWLTINADPMPNGAAGEPPR